LPALLFSVVFLVNFSVAEIAAHLTADLPLSPALVVLLAVILVPAGDFFRFRLLPLFLLEEVVGRRDGSVLIGLPGILVLLRHEILPL
jgi:hypothetical protein